MCTRRRTALTFVVATAALVSCGGPSRTGSAFCAQLGKELPSIGMPIETPSQVSAMVGRYERLLERSPLSIEDDMRTLVDLLRKAESVDTGNADEVQELANAAYAAQRPAENVRTWVKSTCAVDLATGLFIEPPRTAPPTTVPPSTTTTTAAP